MKDGEGNSTRRELFRTWPLSLQTVPWLWENIRPCGLGDQPPVDGGCRLP
jgi:hypothetical protein